MKVLIILSLPLLFACANSQRAGSPIPPVAEPKAGDALAADRLEVRNVERSGDGESSRGAIVDVVEREGKELHLQYLIRWYGEDGSEIRRGELVWQDLDVQPYAGATLSSVAPAPWCVRFAVEFRERERG